MVDRSNVTPLLSSCSASIVLIEESSEGTLKAWMSPRWLVEELFPLMRIKLDITRSLLDIEEETYRFPEYRVLEVKLGLHSREIVLYAPFSLDTFMVEHNNWTLLEVPPSSRQQWEKLADLSRHISIYCAVENGVAVPIGANIGDLRAIDPDGFVYLPANIRDIIEAEIQSL